MVHSFNEGITINEVQWRGVSTPLHFTPARDREAGVSGTIEATFWRGMAV
jgi:hypothetical protein